MVVETFSVVENKNVELPNLAEPKLPFTHENLSVFTKFKPKKDMEDEMTIYWVLPCLEKEYFTKP